MRALDALEIGVGHGARQVQPQHLGPERGGQAADLEGLRWFSKDGEGAPDLVEGEPEAAQQAHPVEPLDRGRAVEAVARRGATGRGEQADVLVVVQGPHGEPGRGGEVPHPDQTPVVPLVPPLASVVLFVLGVLGPDGTT